MFSRFSSLFAYVVVGLAISAAATPMGPSREGNDYDDGSKSLAYPDSSSYSSPAPSNYLGDDPRPRPYAAEADPEEKKSPEEKEKQPEDKYSKEKQFEKQSEEKDPKEKPYPKDDDKDKPRGDRPQKPPYGKPDDKDKSYSGSPKYGDQCNVGKQECCNSFNEVNCHRASYPPIRC